MQADLDAASAVVNVYRVGVWVLPAVDYSALPHLQARIIQLAQHRNRELWLTGQRLPMLRRLFERDAIDLHPAKPGLQTCWPVDKQELDNNPNQSANPACDDI